MKLEIFTICDAATDAGGKLNILGSFDRIFAKQVPAVHPFCAVAAKIRFSRIEEGTHKMRITFADADGKMVFPGFETSVAANFRPADATATVNFIMLLPQIKLDAFGEYTVDLALDANHLGSLPLYVVQTQDG